MNHGVTEGTESELEKSRRHFDKKSAEFAKITERGELKTLILTGDHGGTGDRAELIAETRKGGSTEGARAGCPRYDGGSEEGITSL